MIRPLNFCRSFCKNGLDPARRKGQARGPGEYFGKDAMTSRPYCKGGSQMLVFAVLSCRSGVTAKNKNVIVVNKTDHQLPVFTISFKTKY